MNGQSGKRLQKPKTGRTGRRPQYRQTRIEHLFHQTCKEGLPRLEERDENKKSQSNAYQKRQCSGRKSSGCRPGISRQVEFPQALQTVYRLHSRTMEKHRRTPLREETELNYACWCAGRKRSSTTFTGLKVSSGTSTKQVFQSLMEPFHRPGSSSAFNSLP